MGGQYEAKNSDDDTRIWNADPAPRNEQVEVWMWLPGLVAVLFATCIAMKIEFGMPIGEVLLALLLAFFFSFLAIQATGATGELQLPLTTLCSYPGTYVGNKLLPNSRPDITPLTAASKASQIVLGSTTSASGWTLAQAQRLNLIGGALSSIGANQAAGKPSILIEPTTYTLPPTGANGASLPDLTGDFRVGFLLRTSPKLQWLAQSIGTLVATFLAPAIFVLFATAYPCILNPSPESCPFAAPSVSAWRAVAVAVTSPDFTPPETAKWFSICFAVFGSCMVLVRHCLWTGRWEWMRAYHPNMMIISMAFLLPNTVCGTAMLIGASTAGLWNAQSPRTFGMYGTALAAGLMAGEGIGGVVNAALTIMGVDFDAIGTNVLCPAGKC